jgi:hypothetical protein
MSLPQPGSWQRRKECVAAFGRKPHSLIPKVLRRSAGTPLRLTDVFAEVSNYLTATILIFIRVHWRPFVFK